MKRTAILLLTAAAVVTTGGAAAATQGETASKAKVASVRGSAQIRLTYWPDQDVRAFSFDARAVPYSDPKPGAPKGLPTDARGTVKISHWLAGHDLTVRSEAKVDCLMTSPGNATLTAVVTRADEAIKDWIGKRLGFTVHDAGKGGRDRMGFSWSVANGVQNEQGEWEEGKVGTCMGPAAFAPTTSGGYSVTHADLLPGLS